MKFKLSSLFMMVCALGAWTSVQATSGGITEEVVHFDVEIRPGVHSQMEALILKKDGCATNNNRTVFAVHGLAHTAATWRNYVEKTFEQSSPHGINRFILVNLPGHGGSTFPAPSSQLQYSQVSLDDYVTSIVGALDYFKSEHIRPRVILGHSMGALLVEMTQNRLVAEGSSLRKRYGVKTAFLLNSSMPAPLAWNLADSGAGAQLAGQFVVQDPELGTILDVPAPNWLGLFFTNFAQQFVAGTPTPAEVDALGYRAVEPFQAAAELVRIPGFTAPQVAAGIFGPHRGTSAAVVASEQDITVQVSELQSLYLHLTGDETLDAFLTVSGDQAVHDTVVAQPQLILDQLY